MRRLLAGISLCLILTGCSGNFEKDAYKSLAALRAAYLLEEPIRISACKNVAPRPHACDTALAAAKAGYAILVDGSEALALYLETKSDGTRAIVISILPEILNAAARLTEAAGELK
jgi:hypothetical protein